MQNLSSRTELGSWFTGAKSEITCKKKLGILTSDAEYEEKVTVEIKKNSSYSAAKYCAMFFILMLCVFLFQERCWFKTFFSEEFTRFSEGNYSCSQLYTTLKKKSEIWKLHYHFHCIVIRELLCSCPVFVKKYQSCLSDW